MIKSRLDLYRPTDDIIEEDPAYQGFPDVSLQSDLNLPKPSKPVDLVNKAISDSLKTLYGQPEGQAQPNIFSIGGLMQGLARPSEVVQEFLTPGGDKADRERLKQTYQEQNEREAQIRQEIGFDQFGNLKPEYKGPRGQSRLAKEVADRIGS